MCWGFAFMLHLKAFTCALMVFIIFYKLINNELK